MVQPCRSISSSSLVGAPEKITEDELGSSPTDLAEVGVSADLAQRLEAGGIRELFPVQAATYKAAIEGRDLLVRSKTGSGKTLGFAIPAIQLLEEERAGPPRRGRGPGCVVMAPTRELAKQVSEEFELYCGQLRTLCVYGGVSYVPQQEALRRGVDIVVGTPGRMIDLMERNHLRLDETRVFVLDEADEMLRMGFKEPVEEVMKQLPPPGKRSTMLWSATVPSWVRQLASQYLENHISVDLVGDDAAKLPDTITHHVVLCDRGQRSQAC